MWPSVSGVVVTVGPCGQAGCAVTPLRLARAHGVRCLFLTWGALWSWSGLLGLLRLLQVRAGHCGCHGRLCAGCPPPFLAPGASRFQLSGVVSLPCCPMQGSGCRVLGAGRFLLNKDLSEKVMCTSGLGSGLGRDWPDRSGVCVNLSVVSNSWRPRGLQPARLLCPWDSPGRNTGVGSHFLLQGIFPAQGWNLGLLYGRQILYRLSLQESPVEAQWRGASKGGPAGGAPRPLLPWGLLVTSGDVPGRQGLGQVCSWHGVGGGRACRSAQGSTQSPWRQRCSGGEACSCVPACQGCAGAKGLVALPGSPSCTPQTWHPDDTLGVRWPPPGFMERLSERRPQSTGGGRAGI